MMIFHYSMFKLAIEQGISHTQIQYSMTTSCEMMVNSFTFAQVPFWLKSLLRNILYHPSCCWLKDVES